MKDEQEVDDAKENITQPETTQEQSKEDAETTVQPNSKAAVLIVAALGLVGCKKEASVDPEPATPASVEDAEADATPEPVKQLDLDELDDVAGGTSSDVAGPKDQVGHSSGHL